MVSVAWSTTSQNGADPTVTVGGTCPQPVPVVPLQVAPLITDTVSPVLLVPLLATYTVSVAALTAMASGPRVSLTVFTGWPQPVVVTALQRAALITDTLPPPRLATYTVRVAELTAIPSGNAPTLTVAKGLLQPRVMRALQVAPSITDTVLPNWFTVYTVSVRSSMAAMNGPLPACARAATRHPEAVLAVQVVVLITSSTWLAVAAQLAAVAGLAHWTGRYTVEVFGLATGMPGLASASSDLPRWPPRA